MVHGNGAAMASINGNRDLSLADSISQIYF
jgi:hypothetical protein